ncbi:hypothetical protein GLOIN_2v1642952 [Rhizophagus irregularis DAOM 181602=DAOM 197198]|nr:hypothetical protein GLOIN_2v1642952 [Rhizophagus irregularis DAOM 181602=DAOM 197198]
MYGEEERPDRFGTKEDTNVWIEYIAKSVKEPTMRINLFRNPTNERKLKNQVSLKRYSILQKLRFWQILSASLILNLHTQKLLSIEQIQRLKNE